MKIKKLSNQQIQLSFGMSSKTMCSWTKLNGPYSKLYNGGSMVQINDNEFMLATTRQSDRPTKETIQGLHIYNIAKNEWRLWMQYPDKLRVSGETLMFDKSRNFLYLWHWDRRRKITQIDMKTKEFASFTKEGTYEQVAVHTKDEIHIIGGWTSNRHIKFDKKTHEFHTVHTFDSFLRMYGTLMIHIPSRDVLLIFGGATGHSEHECHVREFSLKTSKWRKIENIEYNYYIGQVLLTMDEKYILLIPLYDENNARCDCIMILEILDDGTYKLRESKVRLPPFDFEVARSISRYMTLTGSGGGDILLVYGFVKNVFKDINLVLPSDDIINLIADFYDSDVLHLIRSQHGADGKDHHIISLSSVLN